jgi:DNA invertase Pin-like site-specific DNA recombinase
MTPKRLAKYVAYYRVCTKRQGRSGLGLEAQRTMVTEHVSKAGGRIVAEFVEVESGKRSDRPQLAKALAACRIHNATLIVAKLDRLARNVAFVSNLMESNVQFVITDFPEANRLTIHILAAVAEYEARLISERTKRALAEAKRKGVRIGGDPANIIMKIQRKGSRIGNAVRSARAQQRCADILPVITDIKASGATSLRQIAAELNVREVPTARLGTWSATQVWHVLRRTQAKASGNISVE